MRGPSITGFAVVTLAMMLSATPNAQEAKTPSKPLASSPESSCGPYTHRRRRPRPIRGSWEGAIKGRPRARPWEQVWA